MRYIRATTEVTVLRPSSISLPMTFAADLIFASMLLLMTFAADFSFAAIVVDSAAAGSNDPFFTNEGSDAKDESVDRGVVGVKRLPTISTPCSAIPPLPGIFPLLSAAAETATAAAAASSVLVSTLILLAMAGTSLLAEEDDNSGRRVLLLPFRCVKA